MSGKKKAQKMSLSDFLANESNDNGSWADDVADLPSGPASKEKQTSGGFFSNRNYDDEERTHDRRDREFDNDRRNDRGFEGGNRGFNDRNDRYERRERGGFESRERNFPPRTPAELPSQPPYTAHIANLSFDANEDDLTDLFANLKIANIRLVRDRNTDRMKGFGYVEFEDVDSLKSALELSGESVHGRNIRINVAEPPREGERVERVRQPDRTDVDTWRRAGPLELPEQPRREFGGRGGFGGGRGGFGGRSGGFNDRERPSERPRLNLKPRTVDSATSATSTKSNKPDPFGGAKPVDTAKVIDSLEKKADA